MTAQGDLEREPQPERTDIGVSIASLADVVAKGRLEVAAEGRLAPMEIVVLEGLLSTEERTVSEIAHSFPVSPSRISRVVSRLVGLGLLRRRRMRSDRRVVRLMLTPAGRDLAQGHQNRVQAFDDQLLEGIDEAERRCFVSTAAKILDNFARFSTRKR